MEELNLKSIITKYPESLDNPKMLKGIICDLYPQCPRGLVNAVVVVVESDILKEIRSITVVKSINTARWIGHLESEYGYSEKFAQKAICLWCEAISKEWFKPTVKAVAGNVSGVGKVKAGTAANVTRSVSKSKLIDNSDIISICKKSEGTRIRPKNKKERKGKQPVRFVYIASNNGPFVEYKLVQVDNDASKRR